MMRFIIEYQDVFLAAQITAQNPANQRSIALLESFHLDKDTFQRTILGFFFLQNLQQSRRHLPPVSVHGQVSPSASVGRLLSDMDNLLLTDALAGLDYLVATGSLRLENMPVSHNHTTLTQLRHQMRRHQIHPAVDARLPFTRLQFAQPVPDCNVGTYHQHHIRPSPAHPVIHLVQDAPRRQHPHYHRLPGTGRHLQREPQERRVAFSPP